MTPGSRNGRNLWPTDAPSISTPVRIVARIATATAAARIATRRNTARQLNTAPTSVPSGEPKAVALLKPIIMIDKARPRGPAAARLAALALAAGANSAAPTPAQARAASTPAQPGASAAAAVAATKLARPDTTARSRRQFAVSVAMNGLH